MVDVEKNILKMLIFGPLTGLKWTGYWIFSCIVPRTTKIPGRENSKPWEILRRPKIVFLITRDLIDIFSYFFFLLKE